MARRLRSRITRARAKKIGQRWRRGEEGEWKMREGKPRGYPFRFETWQLANSRRGLDMRASGSLFSRPSGNWIFISVESEKRERHRIRNKKEKKKKCRTLTPALKFARYERCLEHREPSSVWRDVSVSTMTGFSRRAVTFRIFAYHGCALYLHFHSIFYYRVI